MIETSIDGVREQTKLLLHSVPIKCDDRFEFIVQHPFTQTPWAIIDDNGMINILTNDGYEKWIDFVETRIDKMDLYSIFHILIVNAWNLTWLRFVKPFLSIKDFSILLRESWITEENPNMDANVSTTMAISWFKEADKKYLMTEDDYEYWESLPQKVVYKE